MSYVLVTGSAGFIGFHTVKKLLSSGERVVGIDNLNDYYDVTIKKDRLSEIDKSVADTNILGTFKFIQQDISDLSGLEGIFKKYSIKSIINLAAQAGVRHSLIDPHSYVQSNIVGFTNILEMARKYKVDHLTYASTSSVYGADSNYPFQEKRGSNHPVQFYAATKKANEVMAHSYSHLFSIPTSGLRFFTVYGPWGRPDMALFIFTKAILEGNPIQVFNHGAHRRDFTFIDDLVHSIIEVHKKPPVANPHWDHKIDDPSQSSAPFRVLNIGSNNPIQLSEYIEAIEKNLNLESIKEFTEMQQGDVVETFADISKLNKLISYKPATSIDSGVKQFTDWYKIYFEV